MKIIWKRTIFFSSLLTLVFSDSPLHERYHTYDEIIVQLEAWNEEFGGLDTPYPDIYPESGIIYHLEQIGISSQDSLPFWGVKLSDHANEIQDEPRILILGQCHAEEIYGVEIAMAIIDRFLHPNEYSDIIGYLLRGMMMTEVWVVPTHNPEGLKVVHGYFDNDSLVQDISYRKNIRDTNGNGIFDFVVGTGNDLDGVDLNRNYGLNWIFGDDLLMPDNGCPENPSYLANYDYYRGTEPFSELEIQAIRDFALDQNFLLSIAYHSSRSGCVSEKVIYPWIWENSKYSPDFPVIEKLGIEIAELIIPESGSGTYYPVASQSRRGNAHDWFYRETGCFQYLIEAGTANLQPDDSLLIENTIERNLPGFFHLLDRAAGTNYGNWGAEKHQIMGLVTDDETDLPIEGAIVRILELDGTVLKPRKTDSFGRYRHLLKEGMYNIEISHPEYITLTHEFYASGSGAYPYDVSLTPRPVYNLSLDILPPDNYTGEFSINFKTQLTVIDTTSDAAGNVNLSLPEDEYTITITAESLTPAVLEIFLDNDLTIPVELKNEDVIWEDGFNDLLQWEILSGNWTVEDGYLKSQPELVYDNGINWNISSVDELQLDSENSLIIELTMRYELEWDLDHFSVVFNHNNDSTVIKHFSGDEYDLQKYYLPLHFQNEQTTTGNIAFIINTDNTVNYRGIEIDRIRVLKGSLYLNNSDNIQIFQPDKFTIKQNYPNPFNPTTYIQYTVPLYSHLSIILYNLQGQKIKELVKGPHSPGNYSVILDASNIPSGIYFYQLRADGVYLNRKLIIIK